MAQEIAAADNSAEVPPIAPENGVMPPERVAWMVLLGAFACFCILTLAVIFGVYAFLFQSAVALPVTVEVAKGTVGITGPDMIEAVERDRRVLTDTVTSISTDALSQATLQFVLPAADPQAPPPLLAAVTLQGNTALSFDYANTPRFDWSQNPRRIQFSRMRGALDILVADTGERSLQLDVYSEDVRNAGGVRLQLLTTGRYRLSVSEDEARLLVLAGRASATFLDDPATRGTARDGQELALRLGNRSLTQQERIASPLESATFSLLQPGADSEAALPGWNCSVPPDQNPAGSYSLEDFEGRLGMRLRRVNNAQTNGEVRCTQTFENGLNVGAYDSLRVLTTFSPEYQSLSVCGSLASECILMLRVDYRDRLNWPRTWLRGFYYAEDVTGAARKTCASCIQDHIHTRQAVWYTFDSDNLLNLIAENTHPQRIDSISFYASGHQFDIVVGEVILLLGNATAYNGNGS